MAEISAAVAPLSTTRLGRRRLRFLRAWSLLPWRTSHRGDSVTTDSSHHQTPDTRDCPTRNKETNQEETLTNSKRHPDEEQHGRYELDPYGDKPAGARRPVGRRSAHARPPHVSQRGDADERSREGPAEGGRGDLGLVRRHGVLDDAHGEVGDDAADGELDPLFGGHLDL
jgi:hypothetical protein